MKVGKLIIVLVTGFLFVLAGCQDSNQSKSDSDQKKVGETASVANDKEKGKESEDNDEHGHSHGDKHNHAHDEEAKKIYEGYFEDDQVKDRNFSDWEGNWQSVYPYLLDGTLDEVFEHKAEEKGDKTKEEYKAYYKNGYQTNVEAINIKGDKVTFVKDGKGETGKYTYDGYEILTYEKGNRGVRYIFKLADNAAGLPQYIQFSDHRINPSNSDHYHLYWGDDRKALLNEVEHWPTYYPAKLSGHEIAHEMMDH